MAGRFAIETVFKSVDQITKPFNKMQQRVRRGTEKIRDSFNKLNGPLSKFTKGLAKIGKKGLMVGGAALATGIGLTTIAVNKLADSTDRLAKSSRRLDFPIEELQQWQFIAGQSGVDQELFNKSLGAFSKRLGEAKNGQGPLVSGLKKANPELLKQLQATDDVAQALDIFVKAMRAETSATQQAALANAAFSRSGLALVNIAHNSADAIENLKKEQAENGVITMKQAENVEAYNDAMDSLKRTGVGLMQSVLLPVFPMLTRISRELRAWAVANKDLIKTRILDFFTELKQKAEAAWAWLNEEGRLQSFIATISTLGAMVATTTAFLIEHGDTVAIVVGSIVTLNALLTTFIGVMTAVNVVMALNPIGLIVIGIAALIAGVAALVYYKDDVIDFFKSIAPDFVVEYFDRLIGRISGFIKLTKAAFSMTSDLIDKAADLNPVGNVKEFFGFGDDKAEQQSTQRGQVVTPQERTARTIEENRTTNTAELLIRDETGRAEISTARPAPGIALNLAGSGGF